jgi:signal transduction histidine kinase
LAFADLLFKRVDDRIQTQQSSSLASWRRQQNRGSAMSNDRTATCATACGLFAVLSGCSVLLGWAFDIVWLKSIVPGFVAMNPLTALCTMLAGGSLLLLRNDPGCRKHRLLAHTAAVPVALLGLLRLSAYIFHHDFDVDRLLFAASLGDNRMAPNTAVCLMLTGLALLLIDVVPRRGFWPAQILAFTVATIALVSLVGYGYGTESLYHISSFIPMALNTALIFLSLSIGILLSRPQRGLMAVLLHDGPGGVMARRFLPAIIGIPCILGWLRILGQRMNYYDTEFGAAFMVAITIVLFVVAVGWIAAALNRSEDERRQTMLELRRTEHEVRQLNEQLEQRVAQRTNELAVTNADLVQKNRENEMFVYSVSHDLRSPLVNLQGFSNELTAVSEKVKNLLTSAEAPPELQQQAIQLVDDDMRRSIHFIQSAVSRLSNIIDALLRLSRAGRVEYQPGVVNVQAVVGRIVEAMAATIDDRGAAVEIGSLPDAWGDPTAVEQVFANLIGNAVNYLDPSRPGKIQVSALQPDASVAASSRSVTYYVRDNGLGIPENYHGKVFQALKRLHPEVAKGEGIGLAIVRRIVERHGGTISFESAAKKGTTFCVSLPAAPIHHESPDKVQLSYTDRRSEHEHRGIGNLVGRR